jgi:hypothetical protein
MSLHSVYARTSLLAMFFMTLHGTDDVIRKEDVHLYVKTLVSQPTSERIAP